jgi:hypothetical protein
MIGAGLFLTSSKAGRDLSRQASDLAGDLSEEARRRAQEFGDEVSQGASDVKNSAADALSRTGETLTGLTDQLRRTGLEAADAAFARAGAVSQVVQGAAGQTADAIGITKDKISQAAGAPARMVQETSDFVRDTATRAARSGQEFVDATRAQASRLGEQAVGTVRDTVQQNPLLVAGVGLLIGALIASALPKSDLEQNLAGDASNAVKRKAREAAAAGFDAAKGATGEILTNVAQQAAAEGLTPDGLARSAQDVGQRVQRVAERAVTTAFDPDYPSNTGGERQNG